MKATVIFLLTWQISSSVSNSGLLALVVFLYKLFQLLSRNGNDILQHFSVNFPKTRDAALRMIGIDKNAFFKYIVCPSCDSCYNYDNNEIPKKCSHIEFPNHPHISQRQPCGTYLTRTIRTSSLLSKVKPMKLYAYQSLKVALANLLNRDGYLEQCEQWREREKQLAPGYLEDIYDGRVWQNFRVIGDINFLELLLDPQRGLVSALLPYT